MSKINRISVKDVSKHHKYQFGSTFVYTPYELYQSQNTFIEYVYLPLFRLLTAWTKNKMHLFKVPQERAKLSHFSARLLPGLWIISKHHKKIHLKLYMLLELMHNSSRL